MGEGFVPRGVYLVDPSTRPAGSTCEVEPETATSTEEAADPSDCHMSSMDVPSWISFTQVTARTSLKVNATDLAHRTSAAMVRRRAAIYRIVDGSPFGAAWRS